MNRKSISFLLGVGLVAALAVGAVAYRSVQAAASGTSSASALAAVPASIIRQTGVMNQGGNPGIGGGYTNEALATALGITTDDLAAAQQKANQAALDEAVKAGLITQAQADELSANGAAAPFGGRWSGWLSQNGIDFDALLANALGISTGQLQAAYLQAHNAQIDQAVTDGRITQEQADLMKGQAALYASQDFQTSMQSAFEAAVQQAVTSGVITQAQADQILQNSSGFGGFPGRGGFDGFGGPGMGGGRGGHGGPGGWGGDLNAQPGSPQTAPTTPATPAPSSSSGVGL